MGLDVFFRRDAANFLRSTARAMGGGIRLSAELLDGVETREQERLRRAYQEGARDALVSVGLAFGLEPVGPEIQTKPGVSPGMAGLLWAENPQER